MTLIKINREYYLSLIVLHINNLFKKNTR